MAWKHQGQCKKRNMIVNGKEIPLQVDDDQLCDLFESKRKTRYRVCCRNCKHFHTKKMLESHKNK